MPKPSQHAGLERRIQPPANSTWNVEEPVGFEKPIEAEALAGGAEQVE
jgi:hypothetical protein